MSKAPVAHGLSSSLSAVSGDAVPVVAFVLTKNFVDPRALMIPGFALVAISYVLQYFGTTSTAYFGTFVTSVLVWGAGFGMLFSPIATSFLGALPQTLFARGLAPFKFLLVCGGTFATTVLQVVVDHRQTLHATELGSALQPVFRPTTRSRSIRIWEPPEP